MREIKFRAWDTVAKKFLHPWPEGFHIFGETTCFDTIGMELSERNPEKTVLEKLNDVIVEQFTGLKDKNGKKEYHKDIIWHFSGMLGVIKWDEKKAGWCYDWQDGTRTYPRKTYDVIDYEIIGNVHENPELLKQAGP